jgi:hypothetical protein
MQGPLNPLYSSLEHAKTTFEMLYQARGFDKRGARWDEEF